MLQTPPPPHTHPAHPPLFNKLKHAIVVSKRIMSILQDVQLNSIVLIIHKTIKVCVLYWISHIAWIICNWKKYIQMQHQSYLEQLPFSCCMYASHLLKSLGYFSLQCHKILISQVEHFCLHHIFFLFEQEITSPLICMFYLQSLFNIWY